MKEFSTKIGFAPASTKKSLKMGRIQKPDFGRVIANTLDDLLKSELSAEVKPSKRRPYASIGCRSQRFIRPVPRALYCAKSIDLPAGSMDLVVNNLASGYKLGSVTHNFVSRSHGGTGEMATVIKYPDGSVTLIGPDNVCDDISSAALKLAAENQPASYPDFNPVFSDIDKDISRLFGKPKGSGNINTVATTDPLKRVACHTALAIATAKLDYNAAKSDNLILPPFTMNHVAAFVIDLFSQRSLPGSWDNEVSKLKDSLMSFHGGGYDDYTLIAIIGVMTAIGIIDSRPGVTTAILKRLDVVEQRAELLKISATENKLRNSRKKTSKYVMIESGKAVFKQSLPANYIRIFSNKFVSHYRHD